MARKIGHVQTAPDENDEKTGGIAEGDQVPRPLQVLQLRAVDLLLSGYKVKDVAEELGIHRQRISEWKRTPQFMAEVRRRRDELWAELEGPLQAGVEESIMVLRAALRSTWSTKEQIAAARVLMSVAARGLALRS